MGISKEEVERNKAHAKMIEEYQMICLHDTFLTGPHYIAKLDMLFVSCPKCGKQFELEYKKEK